VRRLARIHSECSHLLDLIPCAQKRARASNETEARPAE